MSKQGSVLGGALLVAGTSIGGGMLALPVLTSLAGFLPSFFIYLLCWLFMACTGLLFLEISQWIKGNPNILSMASYTLGVGGRWVAWVLYLFLFYCLTIAYIVGCGNIFSSLSPIAFPDWVGPIVFVLAFSPLILMRTSLAGFLNIFLVAGLGISYLAFVLLGYQHVDFNLLRNGDWTKVGMVLPIAFTSFAYQGIVPTLTSYLNHDVDKTRKAILIGSFIPLIAYTIWQALIMGIVPTHGPGGLFEAMQKGDNAVVPLRNFILSSSIYYMGQSFAFFALVTSFLGVALGLRDFLSDGLHIHQDKKGRLILAGLVFIFPLIIAIIYPHIFLIALDYAGGFGCALLLGLLPVIMVWIGRYNMGHVHEKHRQLPGGKVVLILLGVFVVFEVLYLMFSKNFP